MMYPKTFLLLLAGLFPLFLAAQMPAGADTLYGNEWIDYERTYYKIPVAEDGLYRVSYETLQAAGLPVTTAAAGRYQLYHSGKQVPLYTPTDPRTPLAAGDYLEFYGRQNRAEMDRYLFQNPDDDLLNPFYSMFTDTAAYFLTVAEEGTTGERYQEMENELTGAPAAEEWYWGEEVRVFTGQQLKKYDRVSGSTIYYSHYDTGEGFGSGGARKLQRKRRDPQNIRLNYSALYEAGPPARLQARFACGLGAHQQRVLLNGDTIAREDFNGFQVRQVDVEVPLSQLSGNRADLRFQGLLEGAFENQSVSYARLRYPRRFDFDGQAYFQFELGAAAGRRYLEIEEFEGEGGIPVLYDLTAGLRLEATMQDRVVRVVLPAFNQPRKLLLVNDNKGINVVDRLEPVAFIDYGEESGDYIFLTSQRLWESNRGRSAIQNYADYRSSPEGGSFQPVVVEVEQLYDQFGYGLARHPQAIRNFAHHAASKWRTTPRFLLIFGKGREYPSIRSTEGLAQAVTNGTFHVPSFSFPASDHLLLSNNKSSVPLFPVGRIAANGPSEIESYLRKLKAQEANSAQPQTVEGRAWMKRIIHLGGGVRESEQLIIRRNLERMGETISENRFGANVESFYKRNNEILETTVTEAIFDRINEGSSIVTFFGHSSPGSFDFNIDNPENYNNAGKLPFMISLGCFSGNIFTNGESISERFCFLENNGAIAFGASRGLGFVYSLYQFADRYYELQGTDYYGAPIGNILLRTYEEFDDRQDLGMKTLVEQFILHGDPALKLNSAPGADYVINPESVGFDPRVVLAQQDSFSISFDIVNLGVNQRDSLPLIIIQELPDGSSLEVLKDTIQAPAFSRKLTYRLPNVGAQAIGLNIFKIELDPDNIVEEKPTPTAKTNNKLVNPSGEIGARLFIIDNTARPVFPVDFSIVSNPDVELKASTTDALAPERTYVLQIDTSAAFSSSFLQEVRLEQKGGVIRWKPPVAWQPGRVYYWRVSPEKVNEEVGYVWAQRSFTYLPESAPGWDQSHRDQFLQDELTDLEIEEGADRFSFGARLVDIRITNRAGTVDETVKARYIHDLQSWRNMFIWEVTPYEGGIQVVVLDPTSERFYWLNNPPGEFGSTNNKSSWVPQFSFPTETQEQRSNLIKFIEEEIPAGNIVYLYTGQQKRTSTFYSEEWQQDSLALGKNLFSVLEAQGATQVRELAAGSKPYVFIFEKDGMALREVIAEDISGEADAAYGAPRYVTRGSIASTTIGPARSWSALQWNLEDDFNSEEDTVFLSLYGIDIANREVLLQDSLSPPTEYSLQGVSPEEYPRLRLKADIKDAIGRTPASFQYWRVLYEGLPDVAINPALHFDSSPDTLQQGAELMLEVGIENISKFPMDSLLVFYTLTDLSNQVAFSESRRIKPFAVADTAVFTIRIPTTSISGFHTLSLTLNPENDQPEQVRFNNFLNKSFLIGSDQSNPLLDVTFDGRHIMNGDIVSARPFITISLEDENEFLLLDDTSHFDLRLVLPDGTNRPVYFAGEEIRFFPGEAGAEKKNKASIEWQPYFEEDGTYRLRVQARDASGNLSGKYAYEATFEVINQKSISNVLNYPNPFSTATRFVYTLTGDAPPSNFKIVIMTVSGRVVRELTEADLGPLRVGTHQTEYAWDGTDEFGDRLANGVYLYQVVVEDDLGEAYERYETDIDRFFKKNMGKLVILR